MEQLSPSSLLVMLETDQEQQRSGGASAKFDVKVRDELRWAKCRSSRRSRRLAVSPSRQPDMHDVPINTYTYLPLLRL